jgi:hypothetical protein
MEKFAPTENIKLYRKLLADAHKPEAPEIAGG